MSGVASEKGRNLSETRPILVVTGVMAAGKSTVAELLAQRFGRSVHLRGDAFRRMIVSGRAEMSAEPSQEALRQLDLRYRLTAQAARMYAEAGFQVVVQDNYLGEKLALFLQLLQPYRAEAIVLCPTVAAIEQREAMRPKKGYVGFGVAELHA